MYLCMRAFKKKCMCAFMKKCMRVPAHMHVPALTYEGSACVGMLKGAS